MSPLVGEEGGGGIVGEDGAGDLVPVQLLGQQPFPGQFRLSLAEGDLLQDIPLVPPADDA